MKLFIIVFTIIKILWKDIAVIDCFVSPVTTKNIQQHFVGKVSNNNDANNNLLVLLRAVRNVHQHDDQIPSSHTNDERTNNKCIEFKTLQTKTTTLSSHRRSIIKTILKTSVITSLASVLNQASIAQAIDVSADNRNNDDNEGSVPLSRIAELLHVIPTYTIVDATGVPYMVVGEDAKVTGYFFLQYAEAKRILQAAIDSTEKSIQDGKKMPGVTLDSDQLLNPWKSARISTIPLDTAVSFVTQSNTKQVGRGNYYQIASSENDIEAALVLTGQSTLAEGKVPLFYYKDYIINNESPLFFTQSQLMQSYKKNNPKDKLPDSINVTELFAVLNEMVKKQQPKKDDDNSGTSTDNDLSKLVFVPFPSTKKDVQTCEKLSKGQPPFIVGQRYIIL